MTPAVTDTPTYSPHELTSERTATSSEYLNKNGTVTKTNYFTPHFYKNEGTWDTINTTLIPDDNAADSSNVFGKTLGKVESLVKAPNAYQVKAKAGTLGLHQAISVVVWYVLNRVAVK